MILALVDRFKTVIGINSWVAHANQEIFGTDADKFRPERWLEEPEVVKKRDAYFMTVRANNLPHSRRRTNSHYDSLDRGPVPASGRT